MKKRIWAMLLCLTLIFSSSNVAFAAENLGNEVAEKQAQNTVTIHFLNTKGWENVNLHFWDGGSMEVKNGNQKATSSVWPGLALTPNEDGKTYTVQVKAESDFQIIFNNGSDKTNDTPVSISAGEIFVGLKGENSPFPSDLVTVKPMGNSVSIDGSDVTFTYMDKEAESVYLKGTITDWSKGLEMTDEDADGIWSCTVEDVAVSIYEYKFVVNGSDWKRDPKATMNLNGWNNDGNSICIVSKLEAPTDLSVVAGKTIELPEQLKLSSIVQGGNVDVTYEIVSSGDVSLENGTTLSVGNTYTKDTVTLKAIAPNGTIATFDVAVENTPATGVTVDETKALTVGESAQLSVTITPDNTTNKTVTWTSDKEEVATVDTNGVVTAKEEGTANITVTTANGLTDICEVTVKDTISLDKTTHTLEVGAKYALKATTKSKNTKISWTSDKEEVATVDANGVVTAKAEGTATITATTAGGATVVCEITVTAVTEDKVTGITLKPETLGLDIGKTATLNVQTNPDGKAVEWTTSDSSVATVADGVVTAISAGTATITVKPVNADNETIFATCVVTVSETITVTPETLDLVVGDTAEISKTTVPETTAVTWTTSDSSVATVDNTGKVTAVGFGTATITATTAGKDGIGAAKDTVTVNIREDITLKNTVITLENGDTADLAELTEPTIFAVDKTLTWTSSDESVATVADGVVTAKKVGTAKLIAETKNGAKAECVITVTKKLAKQATIKIHYRNEKKWQNVKAYLWDKDGAIPGYEAYHTFPGKAVEQDQTHPQWFTLEVVVTDVTKDINVILSDNGIEETKTRDITIKAEKFEEDGFHEIWVYRTNDTYDFEETTDPSWTNPFDSVLVDGSKVTFRYQNNEASSVSLYGTMNGWSEIRMTKENGIWTYTFPSLKAGTYKYNYKINNDTTVTDPENGLYSGTDSLLIIPGIVLIDGVEAARGNSTKLPERMQRVLKTGEIETIAVNYALKQAVNGITVEGNVLTVDENFSGNTVQLIVSNKYEDTATIDVAVVDGEVVVSPIADDDSVTFNYRNAAATKVYVAGSMTNWGNGKVAMTKDTNTNIWSVTIPNMKAGTHQYKFVVYDAQNPDGKWITDPRNDNVGIEDGEINSLVVVKGTAQDTNKITVKIHYTGRTDYTKWNVWVWNDDMADQVDFEVVNGERIATVELDARASQYLKFIVRKGEWDEQEFGDRIIDLSDLLSGTAHVYVKSGQEAITRTLDDDALLGVKIKRADYDRTNNQVIVTTALPIEGNIEDAFTFDCVTDDEKYEISNVAYKYENGINKYILTLKDDIRSLEKVIKYYTLGFDGYEYKVFMPNVYADPEFEEKYTYDGKDLGATWTETKTTFKLWAPTADDIDLNLYKSGTAGTNDLIETVQMVKGDKGVWTVEVKRNLHGTYYTYNVTIGGKTTEACDPYARTTGVNGKRAMVINLDSTDPEGWEGDKSPNQGMNQTDAIIYELHVRDLSIDESSGITNKGKYLGVTETGTKNEKSGEATGLDHIIDLGVTHIHFLPIYDYGSVDETKCDTFNWGYDPVNYNVPEGSYSTDPYNGEVRVAELKEMVQTLHENNINVVMDVVYNHVYDAGGFAFNQIVPDYFSRTTADGNYSSTSGCGNDTASEREMVRKYIVESVAYWAKEYKLDGFRFDLVGLIDVETINQIIAAVRKINPDAVFYGEGWDMDGTVMNPREPLAKQGNAYLTPEFAYFSDTIRDNLRGGNGKATDVGFISGLKGKEELMSKLFKADNGWSNTPTQVINYASCHDNYTVMDKLNSISNDMSEKIKMNNLSAAFYLLAEGVPLIHAGEEMLRTKVDENGHVIHNSYKSSDFVNSIKWAKLNDENYQKSADYYAGLIEFRKNHEALRLTTAEQVSNNVDYKWVTNEVIAFDIKGKASVPGEVSDRIFVIFNANKDAKNVNLGNLGATGEWKVCIDDKNAGIEVLRTVSGTVSVAGISALVLVQGDTVDKESVYLNNGYVPSTSEPTTPNEKPVTSVKLNKTTATLHVGDTLQLAATVNPSTATNKAVTWTSSNEDAVTVDATGKVTAKAVTTEEVVITVTTQDGSKTATCTITVVPKDVPVKEVTLNKSQVELKPGENFTLTVGITPSTATNKTVTWTTSDERVVTVKDGKITAVAAGTATITAEADGMTATCEVTVTQVVVPVTGVTLNKAAIELKTGEIITLRATVTPAGATDKTVTWTTSDANVVTVDNTGKVTAVGEGTATITVTTTEGNYTAICTINVKPGVEDVTSVSINNAPAELTEGEIVTLTATVNPENATNTTVTWTTSDPKVATVDAATGKVTAIAAGKVTITATAGGKSATCTITVKAVVVDVTSVSINNAPAELTVGGTVTLTATVNPESATNKTVTWTTSDAKVATVDNTGKVTAIAAGNVTITATAGGKSATCAITVKAVESDKPVEPDKPAVVDVTSITLDQNTATLKKGETVTLKATVNPSNATDKTVTWTSSDTKVATVDNAGKVTAVADGTAVITAKAGNKTATCTITVKTPAPEPEKPTEVPVTSVTLNKKTANLAVGKTLTLKATVTPKNATNQKLTWKSSNTKVATVDKNGKVKAKKAGTATITVKTANGKKATCKVTVVKATLNATSLPLQVKKSVTLTATSTLKGDKVKSWKSSNTKVAKVDKKGKVTATSKTGKVTITVTMKSGATATCTVKVQKGAVTTKKLTLNKTKATLKVKQKLTLKVTRNPISATDKITWKSSNPKVATVDKNGKVTAKKAGKVTITAKVGKKSVKCTITVKKK